MNIREELVAFADSIEQGKYNGVSPSVMMVRLLGILIAAEDQRAADVRAALNEISRQKGNRRR